MSRSKDFWIACGVCAAAAGVTAAMVGVAYKQRAEWTAFKEAKHCKPVAHIRGDVISTFTTNAQGQLGIGIDTTPDKTGWLCDDGVTYFR